MTTVLDQLRAWRNRGGPELWKAAWTRSFEIVEEPLGDYGVVIDGVVIAEGAAGLTTALYVLAGEHGVRPQEVTGAQIEALYSIGATVEERRQEWEGRLIALGHDLTDGTDPVVALWWIIAADHRDQTPPDPFDDRFLDASFTRWGPGFLEGMKMLRAARFNIAI
ncbi:hypothetical protein ACT1U9_04115 [Streptomyces sp. BR1]|uniref:hypothetical protein n=1 Tax=Streptomyces sp. BR1 TaxID=1592323 RepID=UPI00402B807D